MLASVCTGSVGVPAEHAILPSLAAVASCRRGFVAACLVTWFTVLPSFLFILAGGPLVESTHNELKFTAPLTAITAAVVGVILNLALFFAYPVLWPQDWSLRLAFGAARRCGGRGVAALQARGDRGAAGLRPGGLVGASTALGSVDVLSRPRRSRLWRGARCEE